jgi:hypothetical protein
LMAVPVQCRDFEMMSWMQKHPEQLGFWSSFGHSMNNLLISGIVIDTKLGILCKVDFFLGFVMWDRLVISWPIHKQRLSLTRPAGDQALSLHFRFQLPERLRDDATWRGLRCHTCERRSVGLSLSFWRDGTSDTPHRDWAFGLLLTVIIPLILLSLSIVCNRYVWGRMKQTWIRHKEHEDN